MKVKPVLYIIPLILLCLFSSTQLHGNRMSNTADLVPNVTYQSYTPVSDAKLLDRTRTYEFINSTRFIDDNNATSMDQIYYRIGSLKIVDPNFGNLTSALRQRWISQLLTFQNTDGGFGGWQYDRSSITHTWKAVQILDWLGELNQVNATRIKIYIDSLQNQLTFGYNSHDFDPDSDVYSSYLAVDTYTLLGESIPNTALVQDVFTRAQNNNATFVPNNEIGGFGKQTNNIKGIYWTSEVSITRAAVFSLDQLGGIASINQGDALSFLQNMQSSGGGFINDPVLQQVSGTYTSSALEAISMLSGAPLNSTAVLLYLDSLETSTGGFKISSTSTSASFLGTYYALRGLDILGSGPTNTTKTIEYILNGVAYTDGYGGTPGETPSLRETFDAIYALNLTDRIPDDIDGIISFVNSYRNPDGGYGLTGSYVESTYRAVYTYKLLGVSYPDASQTISFLQGLQLPNGGFVKGAGLTTPYVISSYRAIMTLDLLGSQPSSVPLAVSYLLANQNPDGGFGGFVGDISDVSSTYRGIRALLTLGDNSFDSQGASDFVLNSQNIDGGYRRSPYDTILPNNVSSAVYSYSATRTLLLLNQRPQNATSLYEFLVDIRNFDGGYGLRDRYTSDIAYTFTSLWLLRNYNQVSGFTLEIQSNINQPRVQYDNFSINIIGGVPHYLVDLSIQNMTYSTALPSLQVNQSSQLLVDTSLLGDGNYTLYISLMDLTGAEIIVSTDLVISRDVIIVTTNTSTSSSSSTTQSTSSSSTMSTSVDDTKDETDLFTLNQFTEYLPYLIGGTAVIGIAMILVLTRKK